MRTIFFVLLAAILSCGSALADPGPPRTYYVRYAINMDFLPPLIGERRCIRSMPCNLVKLDHFVLALTDQGHQYDEDRGRLEIRCRGRPCALEHGQDTIQFRKPGRFAHFDVDDREYPKDDQAVIRYRGNLIGEIMLAY